MNASERFDKIQELSDNLNSDMEEVKDNYNGVKTHLLSTIDDLNDIGVNYPDLNNTVYDIDRSKENELNELIDKYLDKMTEI